MSLRQLINVCYAMHVEHLDAAEVREFDAMLSGLSDLGIEGAPRVSVEQQRASEQMLMAAFALPAKGGGGR